MNIQTINPKTEFTCGTLTLGEKGVSKVKLVQSPVAVYSYTLPDYRLFSISTSPDLQAAITKLGLEIN